MIHKNVNEKQNNSRLDHAATSLFEGLIQEAKFKDGYHKAIF
jgi:hypothetical protein